MEGFVQKDVKADGNYYTIKESGEINLAEHFGISTNARLNPPSLKVDNPNPPASNPPINEGKNKSMDSMDSSNNKNSFKNKKENINKKEFSQQTLQTLQPSITGSSWDTDSDEMTHIGTKCSDWLLHVGDSHSFKQLFLPLTLNLFKYA